MAADGLPSANAGLTVGGVIPEPAVDFGRRSNDIRYDTPTVWKQRNNPLQHNDVFGIAVDMDAGQLYFSRNGARLNAQPGGGGGVPLPRGRPYVIAAVVSSGRDTWTANFGKTKFRYPIPAGFRSNDGMQP